MRIALPDVLACPRCGSEKLTLGERSVRCAECGGDDPVRQGVPRFTKAGEGVVPKAKSDRRDPANWTPWRRANHDFFRRALAGADPEGRVLDLGAGPGHFRDLLRGHRFLAVDFHPYPDVDVVTDLEQRLPLRGGAFDTVVLSNVLEHVRDPAALLCESHRVLRPGGRVLIAVPFLFKLHQEPFDFLRYTHHMLEHLLRAAGFEAVETAKVGSIVDLHAQIRRELYDRVFGRRSRRAKALRALWRASDAVRDRLLVRDRIRRDPDRAYLTGYHCVARKATA